MKIKVTASRQEKQMFAMQLRNELDRLQGHGCSGKSERVRLLRKQLIKLERNF